MFAVLLFHLTLCSGYKVLVLAPVNGKSHFLFMSSFVRALHNRGHDVAFLTSNTLTHLNMANYTEILIDPPLNMTGTCKPSVFVFKSECFISEFN